MALILLQNVCLNYRIKHGFLRTKKIKVLNNITFAIKSGQTLGVIGRNGVGKSSLLKLIAGVMEPDSGKIIRKANKVALLSLGIGFMPNLTGRQNIMLNGLYMGMSKAYLLDRMEKIISYAGVGDFIELPLKTYSAGMRARLGFSIVIHDEPDVILIDEILGVGDDEFKKKSSKSLSELIENNKAAVIVSHNQEYLSQNVDMICWIENGIIMDIDTPAKILREYNGQSARVI